MAEITIPGAVGELTNVFETWSTLLDGLSKGAFWKTLGEILGNGSSAGTTNLKLGGEWDTLLGLFTGGAAGFKGLDMANDLAELGMSSKEISGIESSAKGQPQLVQALIDALRDGVNIKSSPNQYAALNSTFNISAPAGATNITAKQIADQLAKAFNGIQ